MEQEEFNFNIDTTIIKQKDLADQIEESTLIYSISGINEIMFEYGALYIFLKLNKQHQEDIENSFIALANGNG